ncbi:MAG: Na(+)/H(+) antiporter subunit D [Xanthomonadales bacterium]|jgi:multicomponent Na+:H+ antiporter subunit D|nr:Na(+)/H(+) antiporter subunit D [Xanthomonadales bacterium]
MFELLPPGLILLAGALLIAVTRGALRTAVVLVIPLLTLWATWQVPDGVMATVTYLDYQVQLVEGSAVRRLFATIFCIMAFVGGLYAYRTARGYELSAAFAYAAGAVGVSFAGDLITLFLFWELMAIFSTIIVFCGGTERARAAGIRYAVIHLMGGVILKVGIEAVMVSTGSIEIRAMRAEDFGTWMVLLGILINAAAPPLSAWLADAYPESSPTGSVFLSAFTTKTAVLALILLFPGESVLIGVGLFMVFYGIIYALLENDARRILAYSIVNQVGFMVTAVGIGTETALNGASAHAFAHIIYKALLFMSAGVVVYRTGLNRCSDLGGLFRTMPLTCACGIVGALAISSFPFTSGFTTKTLISEAAGAQGLAVVYYLLAAASAGVFLHAGIKFPWFVFFQKDSGLRPKDAPWNMGLAMVLFAFACVFLGVYPDPLYALLPYPEDADFYKPGKVLFYLQLLLFSGLAFFLMLPLMKRTETISLDVDWFWRRALPAVWRWCANGLGAIGKKATGDLLVARERLGDWLSEHWGIKGVFARSWPISTTTFWVALLLAVYVLVYYL